MKKKYLKYKNSVASEEATYLMSWNDEDTHSRITVWVNQGITW